MFSTNHPPVGSAGSPNMGIPSIETLIRNFIGLVTLTLRILDIHGAKTHENQTPLARLPQ